MSDSRQHRPASSGRRRRQRDEPRRERPLNAALELLRSELKRRVERHPQGHLLVGFAEDLDLEIRLPPPAGSADDRMGTAADTLSARIDEALEGLLAHRAAFRPGRVFCLRCNAADCVHSAPPESRQVFAGYGRTGLPRWLDLGQLLLERGDPRVDRLWGARASILAHTVPGDDLASELLGAYRDRDTEHRLHGQVVAGWYRVPEPRSGRPEPLAVTVQLVSTQPPGQRRRYGVNVLAAGPEDKPLEHAFDRLGGAPWRDAVRWAQDEVARLGERGERRRRKRRRHGPRPASPPESRSEQKSKRPEDEVMARKLRAVLDGVARRIERRQRAEDRRTRHARKRHAEGDRPTAMALADLARASGDQLLADTRRGTLVVLGAKNRAHLFAPDGKHVTSMRCSPGTADRRLERKIWRPASRQEIAELKKAVPESSRGSG